MIAILSSFISDSFHVFFGDEYCIGYAYSNVLHKTVQLHGEMSHDTPEWHWGYRHWLFFTMGFFLAIVQIFKIVEEINNSPVQKKL